MNNFLYYFQGIIFYVIAIFSALVPECIDVGIRVQFYQIAIICFAIGMWRFDKIFKEKQGVEQK